MAEQSSNRFQWSSALHYSISSFKFTEVPVRLSFVAIHNDYRDIADMSKALATASVLKPEIRLAQAVSQFAADLPSEQKAAFDAQNSQFEKSAPNEGDVMRLTAELNRASLLNGGSGSFGPRMSKFLYAVQQFTAIGDVLVGGSQNVFACGIVNKVN